MTHLLHLDPGGPNSVPLTEAPAPFIAGHRSRYVHQVRSARQHFGPGGAVGRISAQAWCGQLFHMHRADWLTETGDRVLCGTCFGRDAGVDPDQPGIAFRPTKHLVEIRRVHCPGPRQRMFADLEYPTCLCVLCGHLGRSWGESMTAHPPHRGRAAVWCPTCGWEHLHLDGLTIRCHAWSCGWSTTVDEVDWPTP